MISGMNMSNYFNLVIELTDIFGSSLCPCTFRRKMFAIMSIDIRIDAEAIASTLASSLADNRPAEEHRGSISSRGRWTQRQNLPGKCEAQADQLSSRNVLGNSERTR